MKQVKKISKTINELLIVAVLFFFYLIFIGGTFLLRKIFSKNVKAADSYWVDVNKDIFTKEYFKSQY